MKTGNNQKTVSLVDAVGLFSEVAASRPDYAKIGLDIQTEEALDEYMEKNNIKNYHLEISMITLPTGDDIRAIVRVLPYLSDPEQPIWTKDAAQGTARVNVLRKDAAGKPILQPTDVCSPKVGFRPVITIDGLRDADLKPGALVPVNGVACIYIEGDKVVTGKCIAEGCYKYYRRPDPLSCECVDKNGKYIAAMDLKDYTKSDAYETIGRFMKENNLYVHSTCSVMWTPDQPEAYLKCDMKSPEYIKQQESFGALLRAAGLSHKLKAAKNKGIEYGDD